MSKTNKFLVGLVAAILLCVTSGVAMGQTPEPSTAQTRQRFANKSTESEKDDSVVPDKSTVKTGQTTEPSEVSKAPTNGDKVQTLAASTTEKLPEPAADPNRHEQPSEEADLVNSYNNFFSTYRLGPEDVISVSVFGQDRYSRSGIVIPPSGRISLALVPGGIFVNGKTVEEVADLIKKRYDEYIIEPQVDVSLDKASSYRYSVIGDVAQPGIRLMSRRLTVSEALSEAGGVLQTGDRSKVVVLRKQPSGVLSPITVNVSAIYKGRAPDNTYLVPGDQVIVPGNKFKSLQKIMSFMPILSFARIFTGGIFPF